MESSNVIKIVSAFVAGVIVALGSALIYVKASQMIHAQSEMQTAASVQKLEPAQAALPNAGLNTSAQPEKSDVLHGVLVLPDYKPDADVKPQMEADSMPVPAKDPKSAMRPARPARTLPHATLGSNVTPTAPSEQYSSPAPTTVAGPVQYPAQAQNPPPPQHPTDPAYPAQPQDNATPPLYTGAAAPIRQPRTITIATGTNLAVRLSQTLTTDRNLSGDTFRAALENPIILDGAIIADRGSRVVGRVVEAQKAGRVEGLADLTLALTEINTTDGQRVSIATNTFDKQGPKSTTQDAEKIGGGAALGAIIGAIAGGGKGAAIGAGAGGAAGAGTVLATRGKAAVLPSESRLTFRLSAPVTITERITTGQ